VLGLVCLMVWTCARLVNSVTWRRRESSWCDLTTRHSAKMGKRVVVSTWGTREEGKVVGGL